jgi:invasion protein IalB
MMLIPERLLSASLLTLVLSCAHAYAQTPQRTTATYGDWIISCVMPPNPSGKKSCAIVQSQTNPVSQISISRPTKNESLRLFFQIPANIWFQGGVWFFND